MPALATPQKLQEWKERLQLQKESGLAVKAWCHQNGVPYHCFKYWRSRLQQTPDLARSSFKELSDKPTGSGIIIEKKGLRIHVTKNFDISTLSQCLSVLAKLC